MGEPAAPTPAERAATLELARALLAAVTNEEAWPAPLDITLGKVGHAAAVFRLAQNLVAANDENERLRAEVERLESLIPHVETCRDPYCSHVDHFPESSR